MKTKFLALFFFVLSFNAFAQNRVTYYQQGSEVDAKTTKELQKLIPNQVDIELLNLTDKEKGASNSFDGVMFIEHTKDGHSYVSVQKDDLTKTKVQDGDIEGIERKIDGEGDKIIFASFYVHVHVDMDLSGDKPKMKITRIHPKKEGVQHVQLKGIETGSIINDKKVEGSWMLTSSNYEQRLDDIIVLAQEIQMKNIDSFEEGNLAQDDSQRMNRALRAVQLERLGRAARRE